MWPATQAASGTAGAGSGLEMEDGSHVRHVNRRHAPEMTVRDFGIQPMTPHQAEHSIQAGRAARLFRRQREGPRDFRHPKAARVMFAPQDCPKDLGRANAEIPFQ